MVVKRQTAGSRFRRALKGAARWCRSFRHQPIAEQQRVLNSKLRGHYGYHGITGNFLALKRFKEAVQAIWRKWLNRRSQRARVETWRPMGLGVSSARNGGAQGVTAARLARDFRAVRR